MNESVIRSLSYCESSTMQDSTKDKEKQEIGKLAVWSLSSAKPGFGVDQLRDNNLETFWQSDGQQPHYIDIQFPQKVTIEELQIYADVKQDESYTPGKISIRAGSTFHDLLEVKLVQLDEPNGWMPIPLHHPRNQEVPLRTSFLQLVIIANHQNGRDTHIRQIKVYGPRPTEMPFLKGPQFQSEEFLMYSRQ